MAELRLCRQEEIKEGHSRGFDLQQKGSDSIFVLRFEGEFYVYANRCPHARVPLEYRKNRFMSADGSKIICYAHGAHFQPNTGECIHGPCRGQFLPRLKFRQKDGFIWVAVDSLGQPVEVSSAVMHRI